MSGIPIKGADEQTYITRTNTDEDGAETQIIKDQSGWLIRTLARVFGRFSFDASSQLRVLPGTGSVITTVTTVTTANIGLGDIGKPATAILMSRQLTAPNYQRLTRV